MVGMVEHFSERVMTFVPSITVLIEDEFHSAVFFE